MKFEYENESYNAKIYDDGDGDRIFQCFPKPSLSNLGVSFNVSYLTPDQYEWFCDVVGSQVFHLANNMMQVGIQETQQKIKSAIGVIDPRI